MIALLANGASPRHPTPRRILAEASLLVCCDGAIALSRALGREPDFVVGDGDSLPADEQKSLGKRFVRIAEQDTNDLAKAFRFACQQAKTPLPDLQIAILGATGLREDHTLGNIFRLIDFAETVPHTILYTDTGTFEVVNGEQTFRCTAGEAISIFAPCPGTSVSSDGLQWPLDGIPLDNLWIGTLNRTLGNAFTLRTNGKPILAYRPYHQ